MEYLSEIEKFGRGPFRGDVEAVVEQARQVAREWAGNELWRLCFGCLDLTALGIDDTARTVSEMCWSVTEITERVGPEVPQPAAVCVYPVFVDVAGLALGDSRVRIASVAGGFPSGQTYLEVKMLEAAMAVENGADEVDVVMNVGQILSGKGEIAASEIELLREEVGDDVTLKVIVESGVLPTPGEVRQAALSAALAGADFVKTSTGRATPAATPEGAVAICVALRDFYERTGRRVGFKAAGGIRTRDEAALYAAVVKVVLGDEWLDPGLFRIGASALADDLMSAITGRSIEYFVR